MKYLACMAGVLGLMVVAGCETSHEDYVYGAPGQPTGYGYGYGPSGDRYRGPDHAPPPPGSPESLDTPQYEHGYPDTRGRYPFNYSRPPYNY
jgi:hypothetical protein